MDLTIRFTDQSSSFTNGVEFGRILEKIERNDESIFNNGFPIHEENKEVVKSACEYYGYIATFGQEVDGWVDFLAIKNGHSNN